MNEDPNLRESASADTPWRLKKGARHQAVMFVVVAVAAVLGFYFVKSRKTQQDPVKRIQEKAAEDASRQGAPKPVAGPISAKKEADAIGEFTKAAQTAKEKADAEQREKQRKGGAQGNQPPGMTKDGTAGPSGGEGGNPPSGPAPAEGENKNAYDHGRYYKDDNGQLVEPAYLSGHHTPVEKDTHKLLDNVYITSFGAPSSVGSDPGTQKQLQDLAQRYGAIEGGVRIRPVPKADRPQPPAPQGGRR